MKKIFLITLIIGAMSSYSQDIIGKWKTIDDKRNVESSIMEIYKIDGKYNAKIVAILDKDNADVCKNCTGKFKHKSLKGVIVAKGLTKNKKTYDGEIMDPENDKIYSCYLQLVKPNKLKIRGYIGFSFIGRTQYWYRVSEDEATNLIDKVSSNE